MARRKSTLTVTVSASATDDLKHIWRYSAAYFGVRQANRYESALKGRLLDLATNSHLGRFVDGRQDIRYIIFKQRMSGDGHIVVYNIDIEAEAIEVLHIFHSKQDWPGLI